MALKKLQFPPGVDRENTRFTNEGKWWDLDRVRFRSGTAESIGGWVLLGPNTFLGVARHLHNWVTLTSENLLSVGTNLKLYIERGQAFFDITPIRATFTPTNPFTTGAAGSTTVTVTVPGHGAITGDFVTFSGSAAVDGILAATINANHQVTVSSPNVLTFVATACSAGGVTGGGVVTAAFEPNTGPTIAVTGTGYGVGAYGSGGYGLAAIGSGAVTQGLRQWVGWNFGQDFIACIRDGGIYYWAATPPITTALNTRAAKLSTLSTDVNCPVIADNIIVTENEFVVLVGANPLGSTVEDPMLVKWSDQGNPLVWTPSITNQAGEQRLSSGSYTYAVERMRQETVIWTDTSVISMQYQGPPVVHAFVTLAENVSIASINAVAVASNVAYWMGKDKFYIYDGQVRPLDCSIRKFVFAGMNATQLAQVYAGTNNQFNEVTWYYCSATSLSPDRYVTYNYQDKAWYYGSMNRTAWLDSPLRPTPIGASTDGKLYYHENGFDDGSVTPVASLNSFIESTDFEIGNGDTFALIDKMIPDIDFDSSTAILPQVLLTLKARNTPGGNFLQQAVPGTGYGVVPYGTLGYGSRALGNVLQTSAVPFQQFTEYVYVRVRGRQAAFRLDCNNPGTAWQMGTVRLNTREDGQR